MGLSIKLQGELHREVAATVTDPHNLLHSLLPDPSDLTFRCLGFVDWYGDTMFNRLQMPPFLSELGRIRSLASTSEQYLLLDVIKDLAERCRDADGELYLWFYGD